VNLFKSVTNTGLSKLRSECRFRIPASSRQTFTSLALLTWEFVYGVFLSREYRAGRPVRQKDAMPPHTA